MPMFRKKPVVIEARQFVRERGSSAGDIADWINGNCGKGRAGDYGNAIWIETLEGMMAAEPGDWIIKGVAGEFYPCKPEIFAATYELAE